MAEPWSCVVQSTLANSGPSPQALFSWLIICIRPNIASNPSSYLHSDVHPHIDIQTGCTFQCHCLGKWFWFPWPGLRSCTACLWKPCLHCELNSFHICVGPHCSPLRLQKQGTAGLRNSVWGWACFQKGVGRVIGRLAEDYYTRACTGLIAWSKHRSGHCGVLVGFLILA